MSTSFSTVRRLQRALLGDSDSRAYRYTDDVLNEHIRLAVTILDDPNIVENGETEVFTNDLSNKDKMVVSLRSALNIISPQPDYFQHRSAVLSVSRKGGVDALRKHLTDLLLDVENGGTKFAVSVDYSMDALINEINRTINSLDTALSAS